MKGCSVMTKISEQMATMIGNRTANCDSNNAQYWLVHTILVVNRPQADMISI